MTMLLPVIAMSRSPKRRLEAFAAGADDFVARASSPEAFRARVENLVRAGAGRRKQGRRILPRSTSASKRCGARFAAISRRASPTRS